MYRCLWRVGKLAGAALVAVVFATIIIAPCWAITAGLVDDFNDQDLHGWRVGSGATFPQIALDTGPNGAGDHSLLHATSGAGGEHPNLIVINDTAMDDGNWEGDWTDEGITQVAMDVRNPNTFTLKMRFGIAGPGGVFGGGGGDTYYTNAIDVPPNPTGWQHIVFGVQAADFGPFHGRQQVHEVLEDIDRNRSARG